MSACRSRLSLATATLVLLFSANQTLAQKPAWTPIAELLVGSLGEADPVRMSDVMTRCTALNMILAGMAADISPDMAQSYKDEAHRFIQHGVLIELQLAKELTGLEGDITALSGAAIEEVKGMLSGYNLWLDENIAAEGAYINKEIDMEIDSCQLASRLATQELSEPSAR